MTTSRVLISSLALCALLQIAHAETIKSQYMLMGKSYGSNVWTLDDAGRFTSDSSFSFGPQTIKSKLTGVIKDGKVIEWVQDETANKTHFTITFKDGKADVVVDGQTKNKGYEVKGSGLFFSQWHPQMARLWLGSKAADGKVKVFVTDAVSDIDGELHRKPRTAELTSGVAQLSEWKLTLNKVDLNYVFGADGKSVLGYEVPTQKFACIREGFEGAFADPVLKYKELSQPTMAVKTLPTQMTAMRDGVKLASEVCTPAKEGKYPAILIRTPYGRKMSMLEAEWWASRGYAVVAQDVRGRGDSEGAWEPLCHEVTDGEDTLTWLAKQPWSNGKVGMMGGSYLGWVQWAAAVTHHPALKCIIPQVSPPDPVHNFPVENGATMLLGSLWWSRVVKDKNADLAGALSPIKNMKGVNTLPITKVDEAMLGTDIPFFNQMVSRATIADWPGAFRQSQIGTVKIPVMHVSGVWDGDGVGTMLNWEAQRAADGNQWLVFGPWDHFFNSSSRVMGNDYGPGAVLELNSLYLRFFDTFLKDKQVNMDKEPRVRFFVTGANYWEKANDFPLPGAKSVTMFLRNGTGVVGSLAAEPGKKKASYTYDPKALEFKLDSVDVGSGSAVLGKEIPANTIAYQSEPFAQTATVTGPLTVDLIVSTTAKDATFHAFVVDEGPDGNFELVAMRGTMRGTLVGDKLVPMVPGKQYHVTIRPWWFAHEFRAGHRLVIAINSADFPGFARNPGTGEPDATATKLIKARHTIHPGSKATWYRMD